MKKILWMCPHNKIINCVPGLSINSWKADWDPPKTDFASFLSLTFQKHCCWKLWLWCHKGHTVLRILFSAWWQQAAIFKFFKSFCFVLGEHLQEAANSGLNVFCFVSWRSKELFGKLVLVLGATMIWLTHFFRGDNEANRANCFVLFCYVLGFCFFVFLAAGLFREAVSRVVWVL